jgi:hypothetical protein
MRNTWKVLKCYATEGWRKSVKTNHVRSEKKSQGGEEYPTNNKNKKD